MSFILDALRKSEHERHRQTGPALVEASVAPPRPKANRWATAAIVLLLVNLVAFGGLLLMKSRDEPATADQPAASAASAAAAAPAPAAPAATPVGTPAGGDAQASVTQALPEPQQIPAQPSPMLRPASAEAATVARTTRNSLAEEMSTGTPPMEPAAAVAAAAPPPGPAAVTASRRGSVVYQSLPEAGPAATYATPGSATEALPRADEMAARGAMPELRLELHVWSTQPKERFVFINGHRYREGDATAEGATIEEITRDGVVMNARGNRFLLSRD